jgi:hypothetical protein
MRIAIGLALAVFVCFVAPTMGATDPTLTLDATGITNTTTQVSFNFTVKNSGKLYLNGATSWLTKLNINGTDIDVTKCTIDTADKGLTGKIIRAPIKLGEGTVKVTITVILSDGKTTAAGAGDVNFKKQ